MSPLVQELFQLLIRLERIPSDQRGILPVRLLPELEEGASAIGLIMLEGGRICWASSPRSGSRLSERFLEASGISRRHLERVFHYCKKNQQPLGEHLVSVGIMTRQQLRETLLAHNRDALLSLAKLLDSGEGEVCSFVENDSRSYSPMFTFSPAQLWYSLLAEEAELKVVVGPAPDHFQRFAPRVEDAVCFLENPGGTLPAIPMAATGEHVPNLEDSLTLYRRTRSLVDLPALAAAEVHPFTTVIRNHQHGWLASHVGPHVALYRLHHSSELGLLLSNLLRDYHGHGETPPRPKP